LYWSGGRPVNGKRELPISDIMFIDIGKNTAGFVSVIIFLSIYTHISAHTRTHTTQKHKSLAYLCIANQLPSRVSSMYFKMHTQKHKHTNINRVKVLRMWTKMFASPWSPPISRWTWRPLPRWKERRWHRDSQCLWQPWSQLPMCKMS
jgi:hypothetical protein